MPDPSHPTTLDISAADLKQQAFAQSSSAFTLRGEPVLLAPDVALIFQVETREIVQNIKQNPEIFPERYAFELTPDEVSALRSAGLIPKPGRGGSRALPWAITRKGAMRLATIMKTPRAIQATLADKEIDRILKRIDAVKAVMALYHDLEPSALIDLTRSFVAPQLTAPPVALPTKKDRA
jgi:hypothetical protein